MNTRIKIFSIYTASTFYHHWWENSISNKKILAKDKTLFGMLGREAEQMLLRSH
jgi:hypothetical protein